MEKDFEEICENVDAALFSGDALWIKENRSEFRKYLERWNRALINHLESEISDQEAN